MANWKTLRVSDILTAISEEKYVLPVIQRSLVWTEDKMQLLFDTLLKGDSFGGIMVIEEERDTKPLFSYRTFTRDGGFNPSRQIDRLTQQQCFVIDGQQRLQAFYIGLKGSINGKVLFFDLFSDYTDEYEFKFENSDSSLPKVSKDKEDRPIREHFWYHAGDLLRRLKDTDDDDQVAREIVANQKISDETRKTHIEKNIRAFYKNIVSAETLGISRVSINKTLPEFDNRQRMVELFKRLNDGGTRLSSFDLVASILKGYSWEMEGFLREVLEAHEDINLSQDNLIKLIFLLQDNVVKEMASIEASDAEFAILNKERIRATLTALRKFLECSKTIEYYKDANRSFIPLFAFAYHLFHRQIDTYSLEHYFDNYESGNEDYPRMYRWLYHSLVNGVFRSRGAGWIAYKTGIKKILELIRQYKNKPFPVESLFGMYSNHPIVFTLDYQTGTLDDLDSTFLFYLMYDRTRTTRTNDTDHIMPKSILEQKGYAPEAINSIRNFQLLDFGTNRGTKNARPFREWVTDNESVKNMGQFASIHLIPPDQDLWSEERFPEFESARGALILEKLLKYIG